MGNFECNSMEDLAFSRSFRNWVLNRESPEKGFWENWIARNPDKAGMVRDAKALIYALHLHTAAISEEDIDEEVRKALLRLRDAPRYIPLDGPESRGRRWPHVIRSRRVLVPAALLAGIILAGYFFFLIGLHPHRDVLQSFLESHKNDPVRQQAADALPERTITLPEGTVVRLKKGSKIYFSNDLGIDNDRREVYLDGEAFFDVRKNAIRPFYVYTGQVITKVLGTSFTIRSIPAGDTTTIMVRTGKVSVYRQDDFYSDKAGAEPVGIILTANQQVVYDRQKDRLQKTIAERPERLAATADSSLVFQGTPIKEVFGRLQQLYGIPIVFDEETVRSCSLNATMGNESFYEKLNIICKAIGGSYEEIDGNIVVTSPGCK